ncbi:MAG TPA: Ig-like domain-containing protein [Ramlibacter sp.]|nr:Ig-like domain-containing protein [Ramlibacter sp.]
MAILTIYRDPGPAVPDVPGEITFRSSDRIRIEAGAIALEFHGSALGDGDNPYFAFITGIEASYTSGAGLLFSITGLNVHAGSFFYAISQEGSTLDMHVFGGDDVMNGWEGDDELDGYWGSDVLNGGAGNDVLFGGEDNAADTLVGGTGDDLYRVGTEGPYWYVQQDLIVELAGEGWDSVEAVTDYVLGPNLEQLQLGGQAHDAIGNAQDNLLIGNDEPNMLDGGGGVDTLRGGLGDDRYLIDQAGEVVEDIGGIDTVEVTADVYVMAEGLEHLVLLGIALSAFGNSANNRITGNDGDNQLFGLGGDDEIDGGAGLDTLVGGSGDDLFIVRGVGQVVIELPGGGADTVESSVSWQLSEGVETLRLVGFSGLLGHGNALPNRITGGYGPDTLDGGAGADTMAGGGGGDLFFIDNPGDVIDGSISSWGHDTVVSSSSYDLAADAGVEVLVLAGHLDLNANGNGANLVQGNDGNNVLSGGITLDGGKGNDSMVGGQFLIGGEGVDTMAGGAGWDVYAVDDVGDVVRESAPTNSWERDIDTINSWVSYTLPAHVEELRLQGHAAIDGTGTAADGELLVGNDAPNVLDSAGGAGDELLGMDGDDTLIGGIEGRLMGGVGDDIYMVRHVRTLVIEGLGAGVDTVASWVDWTLPAGVEHLTLVEGLTGKGNDLANRIQGNSADNHLDGALGADTLLGGLGNDRYVVDDAGDLVVELEAQGVDTVTAEGVGFSLATTAVEHLQMRGDALARADGIGNAANNRIEGSAGHNLLTGAAGADTLLGGRGDDTLDGGIGNDVLHGDAGADEARYAGLRTAFTIATGAGLVTVTGAQGTDVLAGIDRLVFADSTVVLNAHEAAGNIDVSGLAMVGRVLSAVDSTSDADGKGAVSWQWFRDEDAIEGATAAKLTLATADLGASLHLRARFIDGEGNLETVWSQPTPAVLADDRTPPTASIVGGGQPTVTGNVEYKVLFSELVTGLEASDFAVGNGSIALLTPSPTSPLIWDVTVQPTAGLAGTLTLDLRAGAVVDVAGNPNNYSTGSPQLVDMVGPVFAGVILERLVQGQGAPIALLFSRPIASAPGTIIVKGDPHGYWQTITAKVSVGDGELLVVPSEGWAPGFTYQVTLYRNAVQDAEGHGQVALVAPAFAIPVVLEGTADADQIFPGSGGIIYMMGAGDDTVDGGQDDDIFNGGTGIDTAVFAGLRREYSLVDHDFGLTVSDQVSMRDGRDTLAQVETLRFADSTVDLTMPARALQVNAAALKTLEELYVGFFNRIPEAQGLGYWIDELAGGMSLAAIADAFHEAGLKFGVYPQGLDNAAFVRIVYANVLGRPEGSPKAPDNDEVAYWDHWLQQAGHSRGGMVLQMLDDVHTGFTGHAEYGFVASLLNNKAEVANYYAIEQGLGKLDAQDNIAFGRELAGLVTPSDVSAAIALVGLGDGGA